MCLEVGPVFEGDETLELDDVSAPAALTKAARRRVRQRLRKKLGKAMAAAEEEDDFLQLQNLQDSLRQPQPLCNLQRLQEQLRRQPMPNGERRLILENLPKINMPMKSKCDPVPVMAAPICFVDATTMMPVSPSWMLQLDQAMLTESSSTCGPYHHLVTICAAQNVKKLDEKPEIETQDCVLNLPPLPVRGEVSASTTTAKTESLCGTEKDETDYDEGPVRSWASTPIPVVRTFIHFGPDDNYLKETARRRCRSV